HTSTTDIYSLSLHDALPISLAVFGVTEQAQDVNTLPVVVDGSNQPVLVAADIEHGHAVAAHHRHRHHVSVRVDAPHILKASRLCLAKEPIPVLQCFGCIGMSLSKFTKAFARND